MTEKLRELVWQGWSATSVGYQQGRVLQGQYSWLLLLSTISVSICSIILSKGTTTYLEINKVLLGYVPWFEFGINGGEEVNERRYTEAIFEIQLLDYDKVLAHLLMFIITDLNCARVCINLTIRLLIFPFGVWSVVWIQTGFDLGLGLEFNYCYCSYMNEQFKKLIILLWLGSLNWKVLLFFENCGQSDIWNWWCETPWFGAEFQRLEKNDKTSCKEICQVKPWRQHFLYLHFLHSLIFKHYKSSRCISRPLFISK